MDSIELAFRERPSRPDAGDRCGHRARPHRVVPGAHRAAGSRNCGLPGGVRRRRAPSPPTAQERLDAGERLPLLGVPIAIKDDVDVAGEVTTYGSTAHGPAPTKDAEVVRLLRDAGAVILGKTAVPEMMIWPFTESGVLRRDP